MAQHFRRRQAPVIPIQPQRGLSQYSSPPVQNSGWCSENFMLGAGMVIIQPSTQKIVLVLDTKEKYWFLPRGRKDIGESLEQTALREAYEESGYEVELLPLYIPTRAPPPPHDVDAAYRLNTEPIFTTITSWTSRSERQGGGEYLTSWYVGQIPENAVYHEGTGMPDEQHYESSLHKYHDAMKLLEESQRGVLRYAWDVYANTLKLLRSDREAKNVS